MWKFTSVKRYTFKPTVTIGTAYAAGEAFGPLLTVPVPGSPAFLLRAQIVVAGTTNYTGTASINIFAYDRNLPLANDKTSLVHTEAALTSMIFDGTISLAAMSGRWTGWMIPNPRLHVTVHPSARFFYVKMAANSAFTITTGSVVTVTFDVASA